VIVEEFIASLKVAVMFELSATPVAVFAGRTELTVGGVVSAGVTALLLPPHPATKEVSIIAMNHISGIVKLSKFFIIFLLLNLLKKINLVVIY
jgi:hypothetical protein